MSEQNVDALNIPEELKQLSAVSKAIWLYLKPLGLVKFSQRDLSDALGFAQSAIWRAMVSLRDNHFLEGYFPEKAKGVFKAVSPPK